MEVSAADLKITDMQCNGTKSGNKVTVTTSITVHNDNDDNARHIQVVVVLPPTSQVVSTTPGAVVGPSFPPSTGSPSRTSILRNRKKQLSLSVAAELCGVTASGAQFIGPAQCNRT